MSIPGREAEVSLFFSQAKQTGSNNELDIPGLRTVWLVVLYVPFHMPFGIVLISNSLEQLP